MPPRGGGRWLLLNVSWLWANAAWPQPLLSSPCCFADMGETRSQAGGFVVQPGFV